MGLVLVVLVFDCGWLFVVYVFNSVVIVILVFAISSFMICRFICLCLIYVFFWLVMAVVIEFTICKVLNTLL